jgi:PEP-CTERM motif
MKLKSKLPDNFHWKQNSMRAMSFILRWNSTNATFKIYVWLIVFTAVIARGQGTFIYDQQSAMSQANSGVGGGAPIQEDQPMGQSFTPSLSSVGFVQLEFLDFSPRNELGATVYVNLLADSITGPVIDSTAPVAMPDGAFNLIEIFFFSTPAAVTPGTTYYFQPMVVQPGSDDPWDVITASFNYPGGSFYFNGTADLSLDLWFREGMVVPEPSASWLVLLGSGIFFYARRKLIH